MSDINDKAFSIQKMLLAKYELFFPVKSFKVSVDDKPWITKDIKDLDRKRKREFFKNHKSEKWKLFHEKYILSIKKAKVFYSQNIVKDSKSSKPGQWNSKVKCMANINNKIDTQVYIDEFLHKDDQTQADTFVDFFAATRNSFEPVSPDMFPDVIQN